MNFKCPECDGDIYIKRFDDGETFCKVEADGTLTELSIRSDGSYTIYCCKNIFHKIPIDVQHSLFLIYEEYY